VDLQDKTKEQLIKELLELKQKYNSLKNSVETELLERKHSENILQESQNSLRKAQKLAQIGVWDWDTKTEKIIWSDELFKIAGLDPKLPALSYAEHANIFTPESWHLLKNAVEKVMKTADEFQLELELIRPDGRIRNVNAFGGVKLDSMGHIAGLFGALQDVTEHKLSESIFRDIIEKNPISIQILNMEGYAIQINPAHTKLFGVRPPADYSIFKDTQLLQQGFGELFEKIKKGEIVYFPDSHFNVKDVDPSFPDSPVWIKAIGFSLNNNNGIPDRIVIMHENITDRRQAEALLNDIIDKNPMSIQIVDKDGFTIRGNPAYIQLFGTLPPTDFSIFDDLTRKSPEMEKLILHAKNGEIVHLPDIYFNAHEVVPEAPDIPLWIRALLFPLKQRGDKPERFVFMHENITERKRAEQELIKAKEHAEESDRLKTAFMNNISHEIRTPLNGILGFAPFIIQPGITTEEKEEYLEILNFSSIRLMNTITDIMDISLIISGNMEVHPQLVEISSLLTNVLEHFQKPAKKKNLGLKMQFPDCADQFFLITDGEMLRKAVSKLVDNSIKFTKEGNVTLGFEQKNNEIEIFVKDTGKGIEKDAQEFIYKYYVQEDVSNTRGHEGNGLGLSIAKGMIQLLGGEIRLDSTKNVGTTVFLTLPNSIPTTSSNPKNLTNAINVEGIPVLLIAEDDDFSFIYIEKLLRNDSKILRACNGQEAVDLCKKHPDINLVLMDIKMPVMNGIEATLLIKSFRTDLPIIAISAYAQSGNEFKIKEAGCDDYLSKPINKAELFSLIKKYFKNSCE